MINANELADELKEYALDNGYSHIDYADSMNQAATMLRQLQADKEQLEFALINSETAYEKQQAEIEALKAIINEAFKSIPAMGEDGEFYHEHHGMDGEYLGYENIPANYVVQVIETILRKASEK